MKTQVRKGLLQNFREYIRTVYGEERFKTWVEKLPENTRNLYLSGKFSSAWYDADDFFSGPAINLCKLVNKGGTKPVWDSGGWGVEVWLKGLIKWIFNILSVQQLLRHLLPVSATFYYKPVKIIKISVSKGEALIFIEGMHGAESMLAYRFAGGVEKVLQLKGCKNVLVQISANHEQFGDTTVFFITWDKQP